MTKAERQNKRCFVCGKRENEHPACQFCKKPRTNSMQRTYDIVLKATIEIGGTFTAESAHEAKALAELELRPRGEISDLNLERCVFIDEDVSEESDSEPSYGVSEYYDTRTAVPN